MNFLYKIYNDKEGFTLIELLVVAAIIGILLAIAIPNLIKARLSANEANAKKALQTLRDAEYEYFEQDLNNNIIRDFTSIIGSLNTANSLRDPSGTGEEANALIDFTFESAVVNDGNIANSATCGTNSKAGYCLGWTADLDPSDQTVLLGDFGWESSPVSVGKVGRHDFVVYADKPIRCVVSSQAVGSIGQFEANLTNNQCD